MTSSLIIEEIKTSIRQISDLGYIAASSKPELFIRDQIAIHLHKTFSDFFILREIQYKESERNKVDLVIRSESGDELLVELKAMISPDALTERPHKLLKSLTNDLRRLEKIPSKSLLGIMIMTDIELGGINNDKLKYHEKFNWMKNKGYTRQHAVAAVKRYFNSTTDGVRYQADIVSIPTQSAWGNAVNLDIFLITKTVL